MIKNSLLITLGHNSSAIFVYDNGSKVIGYEQERLSGIKADSQFPKDAINEIRNNVGANAMKDCSIYISHWFNDKSTGNDCMRELPECKYITNTDMENLKSISENIIITNRRFTHHDAHMWSAYAFFEHYTTDDKLRRMTSPNAKIYTIVADGLGTNEEVLSIYCSQRNSGKEAELVKRVYGYEASLGLMYQYATSFCGMKENQDEYKFLGYEAHIDEYLNATEIDALDHFVEVNVDKQYGYVNNSNNASDKYLCTHNDIINFDRLKLVKQYWHEAFYEVANEFMKTTGSEENDEFKLRCIIAYFIQQTIERFFVRLVNDFEMKNVIVAGGCFYNVKLNNTILNNISGLFCAMPLAGDQGAAIGMYCAYENARFPFTTLAIGKRRMYNAEKYNKPNKGIYVFYMNENNAKEIANEIANAISNGLLVNIVNGDMEFGPRALCNTSTVFLPTAENVADNNHMNNRNEVMPCAPICTPENAYKLFNETELNRVVGSDLFMICTHVYTKGFSMQYAGVMHKLTLEQGYCTGRPQVVRKGSFMYEVLSKVESLTDAKCLVNTSFNVHGRPIAFDITDIIQNFEYQREHARKGKEPVLYIIMHTSSKNG